MKKIIWIIITSALLTSMVHAQQNIYVATGGTQTSNGSISHPVGTLDDALQLAKRSQEIDIRIYFREGVYYLDSIVVICATDFTGKKIQIEPWENESVTISGGKKLALTWKKGKNNLYQASTNEVFDQLFVNGEKRILARFPDYQEGVIFNGFSENAQSPERIKKWKNPTGGFIHAMHSGQWGGMHYEITGKKGNEITYIGGFQNNRPSPMHKSYQFVENIFEELDAPGEWFLDKEKGIIYYYPLDGEVIQDALVEVSLLPHLIEIRGEENARIKNVVIRNISFVHTQRTFMKPYEQLMRSDWCIYRGAALFIENAENCIVEGCTFSDLGGNAIFLSRYNYLNTIKRNHIHHIGASAICLVGDTSAVRLSSLEYGESSHQELDLIPGPKNDQYPRQCVVEDNLIHDIGLIEKQVAGVQIQLASGLNIRHNTIYRVPRAAINVGDGAFGGHIIEYNDAFETVLETSDHGAFNSWGRDRFWHQDYKTMNELTQQHPELILLDAVYTTVIRNNRFRCDHGWDIDLDDGSSNYHIYNNVCLRGGIKLREGFYRTVENNITLNNSLHPHVWFPASGDIIQRNVFMQKYFPISLNGWGKTVDYNFFSTQQALEIAHKNQTDSHSISGTLRFKDSKAGDYTLVDDCKAFSVGFENIPMDKFGVYSPELKVLAEKPVFPEVVFLEMIDDKKEYNWLNATVRAVAGLGDRSAYGLPDEKGIIIVDIKEDSPLVNAGIQKNDVIRTINNKSLTTVEDLFSNTEENRWKGGINITVFRNQKEQQKNIRF